MKDLPHSAPLTTAKTTMAEVVSANVLIPVDVFFEFGSLAKSMTMRGEIVDNVISFDVSVPISLALEGFPADRRVIRGRAMLPGLPRGRYIV